MSTINQLDEQTTMQATIKDLEAKLEAMTLTNKELHQKYQKLSHQHISNYVNNNSADQASAVKASQASTLPQSSGTIIKKEDSSLESSKLKDNLAQREIEVSTLQKQLVLAQAQVYLLAFPYCMKRSLSTSWARCEAISLIH